MTVLGEILLSAMLKTRFPIIGLLKRRGIRPPAGQSETCPLESTRHEVSQRDVRRLLHIPKPLIAEMISHALETDPDECCGILIGKGDWASTARRVTNAHENPVSRYTMDPLEVSKV